MTSQFRENPVTDSDHDDDMMLCLYTVDIIYNIHVLHMYRYHYNADVNSIIIELENIIQNYCMW